MRDGGVGGAIPRCGGASGCALIRDFQALANDQGQGIVGLDRFFSVDTAKVFVQREQAVRFGLGEGSAEFALDAIDRMEQGAAFHFETLGAEFPVGAEEKVEAEELIFSWFQGAPAN